MSVGQPRQSGKHRRRLARLLVILGSVFVGLGGPLLYMRNNVFDAGRFADHATSALDSGQARQAVSRDIVRLAVEQVPVPVAAARPLLEETVAGAMDSPPFRALFRAAAEQAHRVLFEKGQGAAAFTLADTGIAVIGALKAVAPALAKKVPPGVSVSLAHFNRRGLGVRLADLGYHARLLGILLPLAGLACWAAALGLPGERRRVAGQIGVGLAVAGASVYVMLLAGRELVLSNVSSSELRPAAAAVWDVFLGTLETLCLLVGGLGLMLFASATSLLRRDQMAGLTRTAAAALLAPPTSRVLRALRAAAVLAVGVVLVAEPGLAVQLVIVVLGAIAIFFATTEALELLGPRHERPSRERSARRPPGAPRVELDKRRRGAIVLAVVGVLALVVVLALSSGSANRRRGEIVACNGFAALCDRPLNEVVLAASHNSMSAASDGFVNANQPHGMVAQLNFGIRGFLIDSYYAVPAGTTVRTVLRDKHLAGPELGRAVGGPAAEAVLRLTHGAGFPKISDPKKRPYLCHVFCEAGAVDMVSALTGVRRWLDTHPDEVLAMFVEDTVSAQDTARVFGRAGLMDSVYTHARTDPWPTLRQLIRSRRRVLVLSENDKSGAVPWYHDGFSLAQETPYHFRSDAQFSCRPNRGTPDSPLFLLNHWIDTGRPSPSAASRVNRFDVLLGRARQCQSERGLLPNLVAVDWYDRGDLLRVVNVLNGQARDAVPLTPKS